MVRGDKASLTDKQKRKAAHIQNGYEKRGVSKEEAQKRALATVKREAGAAKKPESGSGKKGSHVASAKGGHKGGAAQRKSTPGAKRKPPPKVGTKRKSGAAKKKR